MKLKLVLFALALSTVSFAQNYNIDMSVFRSDLKNNIYEKDSTANALVIYDYGKSFIDPNTFWLRSQVKQKIKILKPEGIERGQFEIRLYKGKSSEEKVKNVIGATYNLENGETVKTDLESNAIFQEENENFTLVKFALPNVKVGSVITVSYETQSRFIAKYQPWYFQGLDPVLYSEYNTSIPGNYNYNIQLIGEIKLDTHEEGLIKNCITIGNGGAADCVKTKYVMKNIPGYKPEDFTTTELNYISRIEYELNTIKYFDGRVEKLAKTWEDVDKELKTDADFGKQVNKKNLVKNVLPEKISSTKDKLTKANAIYQFVLDNYTWNRKLERYDVSIKNLLKEKVGSAFEINLLLENLLNSEGFKVFPILMSTRENGLATKIYPVLTDFNYVIVKTTIDGKDYFLDGTDPYLSFGQLPFRCLNQYGRLMDFDKGSSWQDIVVKTYSYGQHRVRLKATNNTTLSGEIQSKYSGYNALNAKRRFDENPESYITNKDNFFTDITIENHEVIDFDKTSNHFDEKLEISLQPEFIGDKIYLNPFIIKFFDENPFKLQERTYPIDFGYKDIYTYTMQVELDDGIKILEIPDSINLALPNKTGSFLFTINSKDNILTIYFKLAFNNAIYAPDYYEYLKALMNKVVETQNNTVIVLQKQ